MGAASQSHTAHLRFWAAQCAFTFPPRSSSSCSEERYAEPARLHTGTVEAGGGFFPLLRRKLREKQAAKLCRKWSLLSAGTHNYSCGRTEAVHLPEMRERTAVTLVVSSGCEQRKMTFLLASVSRQALSLFYNSLYQDTGARCPKSLQEAKNRCHLYFGKTQGFLPVHFAEISPAPGTPWPPILQHHVQLRVAETTACIGQTALDGGEGREGEKVPFPFITRTVGLWTQLLLG